MRCLEMKIKAKTNLEDETKRCKEEVIGIRIADVTTGILSHSDEGLLYVSVYDLDEDYTRLAACICPDLITIPDVKSIIENEINKVYQISNAKIESIQEITVKKQKIFEDEADSKIRYFRHRRQRIHLDYFNNFNYKLSETIIDQAELTREQAETEATAIIADRSVYEEIERIYDPVNVTQFYGHPVHYRIRSGDSKSAMAIINLIVRMLKSKGRIPGNRISHFFDITEGCFNEEDLTCAIKNAQGTAVAIELSGTKEDHGNFATSYEAVVRTFSDLIKKYHHNTLFFFIENITEPGFSSDLIEDVTRYLDIVDLEEGTGSREESIKVIQSMIEDSPYKQLTSNSYENYLPKNKTVFSYHDINNAFDEWKRNVLKEKAYRSYQKCRMLEKKTEITKEPAYAKLQKMIGLSEIKKVTDQIISSYKLQELRKSYQMEDTSISRHMVFTGNPGSAKTTVARLLADILTEEHVLKTGCLVECSRQDLVGKYVGWTAKEVESKFRKAKGGILFIDEAYSLVDGRSGSFGDEAINTIVQQMENHRDDVIVIFAGYPDRMEQFLKTNEGLRSRIAFHLEFPNYNAEELWQIMELMIQERGYSTVEGTREKCMDVFQKACEIDDYGNGRFVRNYLDQVVLKQAQRLMPPGRNVKTPSKKKCRELITEDFDVNLPALLDRNESRKTFGFCA